MHLVKTYRKYDINELLANQQQQVIVEQRLTTDFILQQHAHLSLNDRVLNYNDTYQDDQPLTIKGIKSIYKKHKIKKTKLQKKPFNFNKYDEDKMYHMLVKLQHQIIQADEEGRIIIQVDESIFNAQQHISHSWAKPRQSITIHQVSQHITFASMMGAINCSNGLFQYGAKMKKYYNKTDFANFLGHLHNRFKDKKIAVLIDNASIHSGLEIQYELDKYDITAIYILPYSPQQNGIEHLWAWMKSSFRIKLTELKVRRRKFVLFDILKSLVNRINNDNNLTKRMALRGFKNILQDKRNPRNDIKIFQGLELV